MCSVFMCFPHGRAKALTLSYDDGVEQDVHLIEIMKRYGLKGTFNLNSGLYASEGRVWPDGHIHRRMSRDASIKAYKDSGMEVAVHGLTHPWLEQLPDNLCTYEILQDRINLEKEFGTIVRGMAYPYGTYSDRVVASLERCGIVYARTTKQSECFDIPTDWLRLQATCHHNHPKLMELAQQFLKKDRKTGPALFYVWGHSYEFERDDNWNVIEDFAEYVGKCEEIWYATNIEIFDYIMAYKQLIFSMDEKKAYNPTCKDLYFENRGNIYKVKPNETINL